ncbi:MAG: transglutaminase family protein, partial [Pseudobdellovibrionaceae bacterium]
TILSFFLFGFIFFQYRTIFTQEASSSLLVGLAAIKVMDYENRRDHLMLVLLGFLLLTLKPLYGLELYWLPVQLVCMISLWWALSQDPRKIPRQVIFTVIGTSVPIAMVLFLVFPRVVMPWALSQSKMGGSARLGFTTDLKPGQVAELASSTELVFRAIFPPGTDINEKELYWKGALLATSEGLGWKNPMTLPKKKSQAPVQADGTMTYELILEPASGVYIFTLDPTIYLQSTGSKPLGLEHFAWRRNVATNRAEKYFAQMSWSFQDTQEPTRSDLQHPALPPRTRAWVERIKNESTDLADRRRALRDLFSQADFTYTLSPGTYNNETGLDDFLFERRRGFCEHFAGAYATVARALGIPARVVSGYQGAEYNPVGQFWRVTQRNAHAWVEVWNGTSWFRLDPTLLATNIEFSRSREKSWAEMVDEGIDLYEALNYRWTTFLIDFDQQSQSLKMKEMLPVIFFAVVGALALFFLLRLVRNLLSAPKGRLHHRRQNQLSQLVQEIKSAEEEATHQDLSNLAPLQILAAAPKHLFGPLQFYFQVGQLYERVFYQENVDEETLKKELNDLQRKWVEIQVLQK